MANDSPIFFFKDDEPEFGFLCQWYPAPFESTIVNDGKKKEFRNAEQYVSSISSFHSKIFHKSRRALSKHLILSYICLPSKSRYMMYRKAFHFNDYSTAREILQNPNPRKCKALGRSTKGFTDAEWDKVKSQVVEEGSYLKFTRSQGKGGEDLKKKLLDTGNRELVEASRFDRVWGVGFDAERLRRGKQAGAGREMWGENRLGKALMVARERIRKEEEEKNGVEAA